MKKNKMMRLASAMMVLTLMSTSVISGTFAKYVTSDSAQDTARVAKFGVTVTASGTLFADTYKLTNNTPGETTDTKTTLSVVSSGAIDDVSKLVAPGTKNETGMTFAIAGIPEVDVQVAVKIENDKRIFLGENTGLPNMTTGNTIDTFDSADYEPIKFTLTQTKEGETPVITSGLSLDGLKTALATALNHTYDANENLAKEVGTLTITWAWDFDNADEGKYDKEDTLLGDLAAGTTLTPATTLNKGTDYNLETGLTVTVTVTQID